ncbi:ABC transporter substrate-binding protein [Veillonella agrestimuris]|uniref:ABC transporter substrate-binding protein n=1 Tax=Veillonella agrestimuris TaxID=2941340 RepID=UPI0020404B90|nr:extracellular solute-binding protein [Veillonella agrestimuris]
MKRWVAFSILSLFVLAMLGYGMFFYYADQKERSKEPVRGELTLYTDLPNNITTLLADKYLADQNIRVTIMPLTEEQMTEWVSDGTSMTDGDIVITSEDNLVIGASKGKFDSIITERTDEVADALKDANGYWVGVWYDSIVFVQNTAFFNTMGRYITTWDTLQKEGNWRVVMTDFVASQNAANLLYNMVEYKGEAEAIAYLWALKPHVIQHAKFLSTPVRLTALGETDIGIGNLSDAQQYIRHSYPIKMIYPADGTSYYLTGVAIDKNTKHKSESIDFVNWLLSMETANYMIDNNFTYLFTNPEVPDPVDALGRTSIIWPVQGGYTVEGKQGLLNQWISQVRFRRE